MAEYNYAQKICPKCGALTVDPEEMTADNQGDESSLGTDTETSIVAGYINISYSGLITEADPISAELLGTPQKALSGKPVTLFIDRDDMVDWFIHRNALFTTHKTQSFEILLCRSDHSVFKAKIHCTYIKDEKQKSDGMRIAIRDYTHRRRALDQLEHEHNQNQIIQRITANLIRSPVREIDAIIVRELKTLAIFTEVNRVYFGTIDAKITSFTLTHEWSAPETGRPQPPQRSVSLTDLPGLKQAVDANNDLIVPKVEPASNAWKLDLKGIHMDGTQSFAYVPINVASPLTRSVIGYDSIKMNNHWKKAFSHLFHFAGHAFLNALLRKENEIAWLGRYKKAMERTISVPVQPQKKAVCSTDVSAAKGHAIPVTIEANTGDVFEIYNLTDVTGGDGGDPAVEAKWQYTLALENSEDSDVQKVRIVDDRVLLACPRCMRQDRQKTKDFKAIGKSVLATCPCGFEFVVQSEMRLFHRKPVNLEGVFMRTQGSNFASDSINYSGKARITNVSKRGIGFKTEGPNNLNAGDQVRLKFTLDNQSRSLITKHVLIKGVKEHYAGGEFVGANRSDITLGFYLM